MYYKFHQLLISKRLIQEFNLSFTWWNFWGCLPPPPIVLYMIYTIHIIYILYHISYMYVCVSGVGCKSDWPGLCVLSFWGWQPTEFHGFFLFHNFPQFTPPPLSGYMESQSPRSRVLIIPKRPPEYSSTSSRGAPYFGRTSCWWSVRWELHFGSRRRVKYRYLSGSTEKFSLFWNRKWSRRYNAD